MTPDLTSRARQLLADIGLKEPDWNPPPGHAEYEALVDRVADHLRQVAAEAREEAMRDATAAIKSAALQWAVDRWRAEVENRPLQNIHRRSIDDTWRQVMRYLGGDDEMLCGSRHDELFTRRWWTEPPK